MQPIRHLPKHGKIIEKCVLAVSALIIAMGITCTYGFISSSLSAEGFITKFWNPMMIIYAISNVVNVAFILFNSYNNYRYRNCFDRLPVQNAGILYFICLPFLIITLACLFHSSIRTSFNYQCTAIGNVICDFSSCMFFTSVLMFLIETSGVGDYGEYWIINVANMATTLWTMVTLLVFVVFNVAVLQSRIYISVYKIPFPYCIYKYHEYFNDVQDIIELIMTRSQIIFGLACILFLVDPFLRNWKNLKKFQITIQRDGMETRPQSCVTPYSCMLWTILSMIFITNITAYYLQPSMPLVSEYLFYFLSIITFVLLVLFTFSLLKISDSWEYQNADRTFNEIIIWVSLAGHLCSAISKIIISISNLSMGYKPIYVVALTGRILQVVQSITQGVLESIILSKNWRQPPMEYYSKIVSLLCFLGLVNCNLVFIDILYEIFMKLKVDKFAVIGIFAGTFGKIGRTFAILQRVHSSVIFLSALYFIIHK